MYKKYISNTKNKEGIAQFIRSGYRDRFYFLPKNDFIGLPDSYLDFEQIITVKKKNSGRYRLVAHLDASFSADILTRFARFYNRTGSPDIDDDYVLKYLEQQVKKEDEKPK